MSLSSSAEATNGYNFEGITVKSLQIVRPQFNTTQFRKHQLAFIADEDQILPAQRKWISQICAKFQASVYYDWKQAGIDSRKPSKTGSNRLYIIMEKYDKQTLRQLKLNPGLKVIMWVKNSPICKFSTSKIRFISNSTSEIEVFLLQNKSDIVLSK